jgi:putative tryptophan/tyrosine transport system substrate-binding protein
MRRREFIAGLGSAAAWPLVARAQGSMPVVAFVDSGDSNSHAAYVAAFRNGLNETGFVDGSNVTIEIHWLEGKFGRLSALMTELVGRHVAAIASATPGALAAKAATSTIPIVFASSGDPVKLGLVASLNRPGGNVTGLSFLGSLMESKRLGLLHEMVPQAGVVAVLLNPSNPVIDTQSREVDDAAHALGLRLDVHRASTDRDLDTAFAAIGKAQAGALLIASDPFFDINREKLVDEAARHVLPAISDGRRFSEGGGLMSYGTSFTASFHQVGVYTGQILKGAKPADLPVLQPTNFEFVINLKTAKALGLEIPPTLLARADEVIE